jgi:guanylate kinase
MDGLSTKVLVMVVGPTAIGKSTLMHAATQLDDRFSYCRTFTTRPKRDGEIETYRHITPEMAETIRSSGNAITYFEHPTTGVIYGTDILSYPNDFNLLDTLSGTVDTYRSLPFKRTATISLTTDPANWETWLNERFPEPSEERSKRLREALASIEWSLSQRTDHHWIVNVPGQSGQSAQTLISIALGRMNSPDIPEEAEKMHETVKRLLSYE